MKKVLLVVAATVITAGCATGPSYDELAAQAKSEIKIAKSMDFLWRDTEKSLKAAEKANAEGDSVKAKKLAQKALDQAKMAQQQAQDNAGAKPYYK